MQVGMWVQLRLKKSVYASAQSDQSLSFPLPEETLDPWLPIEHPSKTDETTDVQADQSLR